MANLYQSLWPYNIISLLSVAPLNLNVKENKSVRTSKIFFVVGISQFLIYLFIFSLSDWDTLITKTIGCTTMTSIFVCAILKRKQLSRIIENIMIVDDMFEGLGLKVDYQRISRFTFYVSMGVVLFDAFYVGSTTIEYFDVGSAFTLIQVALTQINPSLLLLKFFLITHLVKTRFSMINQILLEILESQQRPVPESIQFTNEAPTIRQNPENTIKEVFNIHSIMVKVCEDINDYFGFPFLIDCIICSSLVVVNVFNIWLIVSNGYSFLFNHFLETFLAFADVFVIVESCSWIIRHSSNSNTLVLDCLNLTDNIRLKDRLSRLSLQLTNRKVSFSTAGLFPLDRTLYFTLAGAAACYTIVLVDSEKDSFESTNSCICDNETEIAD